MPSSRARAHRLPPPPPDGRRFEAYGGVSLYWTLLGSSGHDAPPPGGVVDSYTRCTPARHHVNTQFKSFVNTRFKCVGPGLLASSRPAPSRTALLSS